MQFYFLRIVYNNDTMSTADMHIRMGIGKLKECRDLHLCGLMHRRSRKDEYIDNRNLPTRQFDKIVLRDPDVLLTKSFDIPLFKGSNKWNNLPRVVQESPTYGSIFGKRALLAIDHIMLALIWSYVPNMK